MNGPLNRIVGKKNSRPENECWEWDKFIVGVIAGSDIAIPKDSFYIQHCDQVHYFNLVCGVTTEVWQYWFANKANGWPVIEKQNGTYVWSWFKTSRQMGEWVGIKEPCPIVYQLVRREDGKGFNKVRIE